MDKRINMQQAQLQAYQAMYGLEGYLKTATLTATHKELIKIQAFQLNGCALCIDMHTKDALKAGKPRSASFYSTPGKKRACLPGKKKQFWR